MIRTITLAVATLVLAAAAVLSQTPAPSTPTAATAPAAAPTTVASAAGRTAAGGTTPATTAPAAVPTSGTRASWLSDRRPLHVGDILTVTVDEQTSATEQAGTNATANRVWDGQLNVNTSSAANNLIGPQKEFATAVQNQSQDEGDASRQGTFTAMLAVKIIAIDAQGNAQVEGSKFVAIDGRQQEVKVSGLVRADDVTYDYQVSSTRIANASISYKGKNIKPRTGIIGKIVGLIWP